MSVSREVLRSQENVEHKPIGYVSGKTGSTAESGGGPSPPKPPRSAFICFSEAKKIEIMQLYGVLQENDDLLKLVAKEWRNLSDRDRAYWDEEARNDKVRFVREKGEYKGPWAIPKRRAKKHPLAPKRPPSAFLKFSQNKRKVVKEENPDMSNTDVSRLLGEMWRNAGAKEKAPYVEQEIKERAVYKEKIKKFKDDQARVDAASRTSHQSVQRMAEYPQPAYEGVATSNGSSTSPNSFDNLRVESVEEAANKADQRMMYRHSFGVPFQSYHPYATGYEPPYYPASVPAPTQEYRHDHDRMPPVMYRPLPPYPVTLEEDPDEPVFTTPQNQYFSESMNFGFYNRYS